MPRIAGVDIPNEKRVDISLRYLYGVGPTLALKVLKQAQIDPAKRVKNLSEEEVNRIQKIVEQYKVEGDLRREVLENINRLKAVKAYRGLRHMHSLPVRGQRTRSNARTKRGKRVTQGTVRKDVATAAQPSKSA